MIADGVGYTTAIRFFVCLYMMRQAYIMVKNH